MGLEGRPLADLARIGREWLLHGHLQDRVGVPLYLGVAGRSGMEQLAIDEWMTASPIYSRRMQQALRFGPAGGGGDGVPDIFKNLQLDIGAPHQFLDFRFQVHDDRRGEFWLAHCGALMDVEPMGTDFVVGMCHHIEDPTFDATAGATNPYARVRPIHRPPRAPADRHPHCHWTVTIADPGDGPPAQVHPDLAEMAASPLAALPVQPAPVVGPEHGDGGWADYSGAFDPEFRLESLSRSALVAALDEVAFQSHLLLRAYMLALSRRVGNDEAARMGHRVLVGQSALTAERLVRSGLAVDLRSLFELHPLLHPERLSGVAVDGHTEVRLSVAGGHALRRPDPFSAMTLLQRFGPEPLAAVAAAIDGRATAAVDRAGPGEDLAWMVCVDPSLEPAREPVELLLARVSTGAAFQFRT